jgi:hypothetical protein
MMLETGTQDPFSTPTITKRNLEPDRYFHRHDESILTGSLLFLQLHAIILNMVTIALCEFLR